MTEHEITVGYRGLGNGPDRLEKRTVRSADDDAPPWDANTVHKTVGGDADRVDGLAKATGRARYTSDVRFDGMLQGAILRAPIAKGRLRELDLDAARQVPGVRAIVALKQIGHRVRFVGDAIAAVAAVDKHAARDALERLVARYEQEPHVVDYLRADEAPLLQDGQVAEPWPDEAELDAALAAAKATHEATYRTEVQTHSALEPHGHVARWQGDDLEVFASTQATFGVQSELREALQSRGLEVGSVTVHAEYVGGGFGAKFSAGAEGLACCLLAHAAQAPVQLMLDRFEEHTTAGNRPAALMQVRAGVDADGRLLAFDWRSWGGCGFNKSGGAVRVPNHYFEATKKRLSHVDIATDTDPARSMRAPGYPQGWFGCELFLDELAAKLGMDPLALRLANDADAMRLDQWRFGAERFGWAEKRARRNEPNARFVQGVGLASARWGQLGSPGRGQPHGITCRIHNDGRVEVRSGAQDIGTGLKTALAMLTAEELGVPLERVKASVGHTDDPSGPGSGGSTTTPSLAPAARHAAFLAGRQLATLVARHLGAAAETVSITHDGVGTDTKRLPFAEACRLIGPNPIEARGRRFPNYRSEPFQRGVCGAQFAEVRIDTWTGLVEVTRMFGVQDCGLVVAKKLAESQVLGAMIQGVGYALHEQRHMDDTSGRMLNGDFLRYKIAGFADVPDLECHLQSVANGHDNTGAAGLGEPPATAAAAAIANAVFHALGAPVRHLPITPDKVLAAVAERRNR